MSVWAFEDVRSRHTSAKGFEDVSNGGMIELLAEETKLVGVCICARG